MDGYRYMIDIDVDIQYGRYKDTVDIDICYRCRYMIDEDVHVDT